MSLCPPPRKGIFVREEKNGLHWSPFFVMAARAGQALRRLRISTTVAPASISIHVCGSGTGETPIA